MGMRTIDPGSVKTSQFHSYMLGAIAPRPIAFASTVDKEGRVNLSPYSFFNAFGSKPPIVVFSPARRVRDNSIKHTLENVYETMEVVINMVNYAMVQQMSLASTEYPKGVDEFVKAGFTPLASDLVRPPRVKESPVQMECKVLQVIETGHEGGAANLIVCEILRMHIAEEVMTDDKIDPFKIDLVARMGGDWYCRANGDALFEVPKPNVKLGIGYDRIPEPIRHSRVLSGNDLGQLGNVETLPDSAAVQAFLQRDFMKELVAKFGHHPEILEEKLHALAKSLLGKKALEEAWLTLLAAQKLR